MRLSADRGSPYYSHDAVRRARATLDGVPLENVVEADDAEGWVDVIPFDANGHPAGNAEGTAYAIERRCGQVVITFDET